MLQEKTIILTSKLKYLKQKGGHSSWHIQQIGPRFPRISRGCHGLVAKSILLWTQYSEATTLIYMMDVRSKWIQPWFYQLWIHAWESLSGARDDVDAASHCLSEIFSPPPSLLVWSYSSAVWQLAANTPENLDSTFVDFSQEWMQLDCFVGEKHLFEYTLQSIILMGFNVPGEHS